MLQRYEYFTEQAIERLSEILEVPFPGDNFSRAALPGVRYAFDDVVESEHYGFAIECKLSGSLGNVVRAIDQIKRMAHVIPESFIPLLVVPFMRESGRAYCQEAGVSWLDLSGNARIVGPGLYVYVDGQLNKFRRPGRPESAFGPKGARIARWFLINHDQVVRQRALASYTGLDEGYVSRVVGKLIEMDLVKRDDEGIRITAKDRLLDAWRDEYRFDKHTVIPGHITAPFGEGVVKEAVRTLSQWGIRYAVTGLSAAWCLTQYAGFRLSTIYLDAPPSTALLDELEFRQESRGANTWLVMPNDSGVFLGAQLIDGIKCVHPVQLYLDLKDHPERASEAADEIRVRLLT